MAEGTQEKPYRENKDRIFNVHWLSFTHLVISVEFSEQPTTESASDFSCFLFPVTPVPTGLRRSGYTSQVTYNFNWVTPPLRGFKNSNGVMQWADTPISEFSLTGLPTQFIFNAGAWQTNAEVLNFDYAHFDRYRNGGTGIGVPGIVGAEFQPATSLLGGTWGQQFVSGPYCSGSDNPDVSPAMMVADLNPATFVSQARFPNRLSGITLTHRGKTCKPKGIWTPENLVFLFRGSGFPDEQKDSPHTAHILFEIEKGD